MAYRQVGKQSQRCSIPCLTAYSRNHMNQTDVSCYIFEANLFSVFVPLRWYYFRKVFNLMCLIIYGLDPFRMYILHTTRYFKVFWCYANMNAHALCVLWYMHNVVNPLLGKETCSQHSCVELKHLKIISWVQYYKKILNIYPGKGDICYKDVICSTAW